MNGYELIFFADSGASGDMLVASLVDLLDNAEEFSGFLNSLKLKADFKIQKNLKKHLQATQLLVEVNENPELEHFSQLKDYIAKLPVSEKIKDYSWQIINRIFQAEAKVHNLPPEHVHLHEIAADDTIIDIVGFCWLWEKLNFAEIYFSPPVCGTGYVQTAHGRLPLPAPATLELLSGFSFVSSSIKEELLTPTGAAILTTLGKPLPPEKEILLLKSGYGAGAKELSEIPNILRAILAKKISPPEELILLQAQYDDLTGEKAAFLAESLRWSGAVEVFWQPIQMKKNRPGLLLNVLVAKEKENEIIELIFRESPTLGIRRSVQQRWILDRQQEELIHNGFKIRFKKAFLNNQQVNLKIDFECIMEYAKREKISIKEAEQKLWSIINAGL